MEQQLMADTLVFTDHDRPAEVQAVTPIGTLVYIHGVGLRLLPDPAKLKVESYKEIGYISSC